MLDAASIGLPDAFHSATAAKADAGEELRPDVETLFRTPAVHATLAAILGDDNEDRFWHAGHARSHWPGRARVARQLLKLAWRAARAPTQLELLEDEELR